MGKGGEDAHKSSLGEDRSSEEYVLLKFQRNALGICAAIREEVHDIHILNFAVSGQSDFAGA